MTKTATQSISDLLPPIKLSQEPTEEELIIDEGLVIDDIEHGPLLPDHDYKLQSVNVSRVSEDTIQFNGTCKNGWVQVECNVFEILALSSILLLNPIVEYNFAWCPSDSTAARNNFLVDSSRFFCRAKLTASLKFFSNSEFKYC